MNEFGGSSMFKGISKRSLFLVVCDAAAIAGAYYVSWFLWTGGRWAPHGLSPLGLLTPILLVFFYVFDLYYPFKKFKSSRTAVEIFLAIALSSIVYGFACFLMRSLFLPRFLFFYFTLQMFLYIAGVRLLYDFIFQARFMDKNAVILGTGKMAVRIFELIETTPHSGMNMVGFISDEKNPGKRKIKGADVLGGIDQLISLLDWHNVRLLVLALEEGSRASELEALQLLIGRNVQIVTAVRLFEQLGGSIPYEVISPAFMLSLTSEVRVRHYLHLKRLLDIVLSSLCLILTAPVFLLVTALLAFQGIDRIFFIQKRIGADGNKFSMYKFRSMSVPQKGRVQRITPIGSVLRKFRLDELPQFLNVLKGDMSLIGPRPETEYFVRRCRKKIPYYQSVFTVRPGISGWAQVNFGHVSDFKDYPKKFCFNVYYLKNISFELDLQIFLKTFRIIFLGGGK